MHAREAALRTDSYPFIDSSSRKLKNPLAGRLDLELAGFFLSGAAFPLGSWESVALVRDQIEVTEFPDVKSAKWPRSRFGSR
jgi:hypothetical protein